MAGPDGKRRVNIASREPGIADGAGKQAVCSTAAPVPEQASDVWVIGLQRAAMYREPARLTPLVNDVTPFSRIY